MKCSFTLKAPIFVTFTRNGVAREEVIKYVWGETVSIPDDFPIDLTEPQYLGFRAVSPKEFADRIEADHYDRAELLTMLASMDLDEGIRDAYAMAKDRAMTYLDAKGFTDLWYENLPSYAEAASYVLPDRVMQDAA